MGDEIMEAEVAATLGVIVFKADNQFALIRDKSRGGQMVLLTHEEAAFVRDQIDAAIKAGLVKP